MTRNAIRLRSAAISPCVALSLVGTAQSVTLPLTKDSTRFAVIGDTGTGDKAQYEIGRKLEEYRQRANFTFTIMVGDNIYGSERPQDFKKKFEMPYKPLLDAGVKFYAALGNHDDPNQRFYKPFNMNSERFYTFTKGNIDFFVLDSNYMDRKQLDVVRARDQGVEVELEDGVLPPSALFVRGGARLRGRSAHACSSRCSSNTGWTSCLPATSISTSVSNHRKAFTTSPVAGQRSSARATSGRDRS